MPYEERHAPPGEEPLPAETDDFYDSGKPRDVTVDKRAAAGRAAGRMLRLPIRSGPDHAPAACCPRVL